MWGASSKGCELNCQCSGLITDNFKINSGNNSTKRKREESLSYNYKTRMNPHTIDFNKSPGSPNLPTSKRRILGEIQLSTPPFERIPSPVQRMSPFQRIKTPTQTSPFQWKSSPTHTLLLSERRTSPAQIVSPVERRKSPVLTKKSDETMVSSLSTSRKQCKLSRVFEDRTQFKLANKENENVSILSETFMEFDMGEEARDCSFSERFGVTKNTTNWTNNLDFTDAIAKPEDLYVPEKELTEDEDITLMDLDHEFDSDNFDQCTNYEIVSTDSPNIISQGRATSRKVTARNFMFGAPLAENETSTSFNRPNTATRMLNFDEEEFEFTSPPVKCVKKSLQFEQPKLRHNTSNSSIGSMSGSSMTPNKTRLSYISESTVSVESGFVSEFEEPSLDNDERTNSPKMENICELISGKIKNNLIGDKVRWPLSRSLSCNPGKAKVSLLSILESPVKRNIEDDIENINTKRRKSNRNVEVVSKPVLQRALSENNASIMSALARSVEDPDLIGDFTRTFSLPLTVGEHADLKSICCDTLARLVRGEYKDVISDYKVIDCRYPYEYEGGHIAGAINCYSPTLVSALLHHHTPLHSPERTVLVFHCEFSKERGPKLSRYLRSSDREKNKDNYPNLHYPEIYLLHEGYRSFYRRYPELCSPCGYIAMLDPTYKSQLRVHRNVSQPPSTTQSHKRNRLLF